MSRCKNEEGVVKKGTLGVVRVLVRVCEGGPLSGVEKWRREEGPGVGGDVTRGRKEQLASLKGS